MTKTCTCFLVSICICLFCCNVYFAILMRHVLEDKWQQLRTNGRLCGRYCCKGVSIITPTKAYTYPATCAEDICLLVTELITSTIYPLWEFPTFLALNQPPIFILYAIQIRTRFIEYKYVKPEETLPLLPLVKGIFLHKWAIPFLPVSWLQHILTWFSCF